jgi:hypothetical protein
MNTVFNHADIMHSQVVWARDLGAEHNQQLLNLLDRTTWLVEADRRDPKLVPYAEATPPAAEPGFQRPNRADDQE